MVLAPQILEMLAAGDGLKASDMAQWLGVERGRINSVIYGSLKGEVRQDKSYRWYLSSQANSVGSVEDRMSVMPFAPKQFSGSLEQLYDIHPSTGMRFIRKYLSKPKISRRKKGSANEF